MDWTKTRDNCIYGYKDLARELAIKCDLPICPGVKNNEINTEDLEKKCRDIGFPILVKSSAGGGGIGMQIARDYNQLVEAVEKTKNLAEKAFGNSDIFLEKFIENARHIEIQIFGFGEKGAIHFYERDCSIQRRFQKIIEESPAPNIDNSIINKMSECAVNFATNQQYEGAGTIEFIYDINKEKFFFLEMNTRIQVEHPVTEVITNTDLVEMQIRFALKMDNHTFQQNDVSRKGHAMECRLYAEDPSKQFLPSPGKITKLKIPKNLKNIRLDMGVEEGDEITFYYDPMIAKIIAKEESRKKSIEKMIDFLTKIKIEGIHTNQSFLLKVLQNEHFVNATYNTKFIENNLNLILQKKGGIGSLEINEEATKKLRQEKISAEAALASGSGAPTRVKSVKSRVEAAVGETKEGKILEAGGGSKSEVVPKDQDSNLVEAGGGRKIAPKVAQDSFDEEKKILEEE